ncbi:MAG: tyrosyl-tRNA synthetase [Alyxoria varia]|nr:MAG: tyrosyl-tRNA synthetase [Alyxoria varia]
MLQAPRLLGRVPKAPRDYICRRCQQQRRITQGFLQKKKDAEEQWKGFAKEIRAGQRKSMLDILEERCLVNDVAGKRSVVNDLMINKRSGVYCGIDPTALSLHIGHMLPLMALFWMYLHGMHAVSLLGGTTSKIGDPTGRVTSREQMTGTERKSNIVAVHYQLRKLWQHVEQLGRKKGYVWEKYWHREIVNNNVWWNKLTMNDIMNLLGDGIRMGPMLSKDIVKTKLNSPDGMSFSEFCYPIMQGYDWWHMYETKGIQLQIGGSDQYGNIVAGMDVVKHIAKHHPNPDVRVTQTDGFPPLDTPYGFTTPLLTTSSGEKLGKSAGNAIWMDEQLTKPFDLYGFFVSIADTDVERYLKQLTFLSIPEIHALMVEHNQNPSKRIAQKALAKNFVELAHGFDTAEYTEAQHEKWVVNRNTLDVNSLLSEQSTSSPKKGVPTTEDNPLAQNQNKYARERATFIHQKLNPHAPQADKGAAGTQIILPRSLVVDQPISRILYSAGFVTSRSEGHRLVESKGVYYGSRAGSKDPLPDQVTFTHASNQNQYKIHNAIIRDNADGTMDREGEEGILILRAGKWRVRVLRLVSDAKFEEMGLPDPPGWRELKSVWAAERAEASNEAHRNPTREKTLSFEGEIDSEVEDLQMPGRADSRRATQKSYERGREYFNEHPEERDPQNQDPAKQTHLPAEMRNSLYNPDYLKSLSPERLAKLRRIKHQQVVVPAQKRQEAALRGEKGK